MNMDLAVPDLMTGIPRGLPTKYLKDQSIPQARWQKQETIESSEMLAYDPENPDGKVLLGAVGDKLIGVRDNRHMQTIAGNRSGKSVTVIANMLLSHASMMAIDPKGELASITAQRRADMGQKVIVVDPFGRAKGKAKQYRGSYNPLMTLDADSDVVIENAVQIIDALIVQTGNEHDPHWNESAAQTLIGFVLYVRFGRNLKDNERNLITVRRLVKKALN